jgi:hypothetical protein
LRSVVAIGSVATSFTLAVIASSDTWRMSARGSCSSAAFAGFGHRPQDRVEPARADPSGSASVPPMPTKQHRLPQHVGRDPPS